MGIKGKIRFGFLTIGTLLFISGLISSLELVRFNRATHNLLTWNQSSIEISKQMLDAVQEQNTALLLCITDTTDQNLYSVLLSRGSDDFTRAMQTARETIRDHAQLETIQTAAQQYNETIAQVSDSSDIAWFTDVYKTSYYNLTQAIKNFMVQLQQGTLEYTAHLETNANRASMVSIIALGGGILLMLVFYFMLNNYFISPIIKITNALRGCINSRLPFEVTIGTKDELLTLKEYIATIVAQNKKKQ